MKSKVKNLYMCGDAPCGPCKQRAAMKTDLSRRVSEYNKHKQMMQRMTIAGELTGSKPIVTEAITGDPTAEVATFVKPEDKLAAWLAVKIYNHRPSQVMDYSYAEELSSSRVGVWLGCRSAYVIFRGTQPLASGGVNDIIDDFILASDNTCDLSITQQGMEIIQEVFSRGYMDIRLSGHSLGGRAALCLGAQPGVTKVVALNAGAPVISPTSAGPGPQRATHYHIVGDIVSTHLEDSAAENIRILIGNPPRRVPYTSKLIHMDLYDETQLERFYPPAYDIDWLNSDYHSSTRFLVGDTWSITTAQEEQNSLELFTFETGDAFLKLTSAGASLIGFPFDKLIKTSVCQNPIPGSSPGKICETENSELTKVVNEIGSFLLGVSGAILGLLALGPGGVVLGFKAGSDLSKGNLMTLASELIPGYELMAEGNKAFIRQVIEDIRRRRGDTLDDILQDRFGKFGASRVNPNDPIIQKFYRDQLTVGL